MRQIAGPRVAELMRPAGSFRVKGISESVATALVRWREDDGEDAPPAREAAPLRPITVVIADDQRLLRTGFRVILDAEPDITVVGEAADGYAAVDVVARRRPDVVLMDIRMPELDGLAAAERILADPENTTAVVMLTTFDASEYVFKALRDRRHRLPAQGHARRTGCSTPCASPPPARRSSRRASRGA